MKQNPFILRGMIKSTKSFWGRTDDLQNIYSCLLDSENEPQSIAIMGQRRIGKSSLLYRIFKKELANEMYSEQLQNTITVMLSMQNFVTSTCDAFYERILDDIRNSRNDCTSIVDEARAKCGDNQEKNFFYTLRRLDQNDFRTVIIIDEFEAISQNSNFDLYFFDKLRSNLQERRLAFVISFQTDLAMLWDGVLVNSPHSSPFFNVFQYLNLRGFKEEEVTDYFSNFNDGTCPDTFNSDEISLIRQIGGRHPYFLNIAAYHVYENKLSERDKPLAILKMEIENDPAVLSTFTYYWRKLSASQRKLLLGLIFKDINPPYQNEVQKELHWLYKLHLLEMKEGEGFAPFSECFGQFVAQRLINNPSEKGIGYKSVEDIFDILSLDESTNWEFKSSLRWDCKENKKNDQLEINIIKTIAGFLNTHGGTLIIGVDDDKNILGLDNDYKTFTNKPNKDGFELHLYQIIKNRIGPKFCELIAVKFLVTEAKDICIIVVQPSSSGPAFVDNDKLFYRTGNSTDFARTSQGAIEYFNTHWKNNSNGHY